mmetsp:Transcript_30445/g.40214  ORF Transcript_30445/g.40214 Transcript_30445/m.40214 type:complete len:149 (+) Transcript_30445:144-590(+)|eukprot:CAMPEP_0117754116 /NCGR_PEP_ID=MMETSP0947-20121206/12638_1 /TAXON_ID=44440 /ORGANISM="Chattonella subsalsa, Strain CCMP2191" /LENGTH=148 /DNA_ID=CAMNT_0005573145 /DNA_START=25 /DNA_END=471 /DNA_ORIENTATION=+
MTLSLKLAIVDDQIAEQTLHETLSPPCRPRTTEGERYRKLGSHAPKRKEVSFDDIERSYIHTKTRQRCEVLPDFQDKIWKNNNDASDTPSHPTMPQPQPSKTIFRLMMRKFICDLSKYNATGFWDEGLPGESISPFEMIQFYFEEQEK